MRQVDGGCAAGRPARLALRGGRHAAPTSEHRQDEGGPPLADRDRWPWLEKIAEWVDDRLGAGEDGLITCSALKRSYRDLINRKGRGVFFVYLAGTEAEIAARLAARHGHFMAPALLESQFDDLQEPADDEPAIRIDIGPPPAVIADGIIERLALT